MRITTVVLVSFALFAVANAVPDEQPRIRRWFSNPADGCTHIDCAAISTKRECAKLGKGGKDLIGKASCCQWNAESQTCSSRSCSWFNEKNCNAAPHCGWSTKILDSEGQPQCIDRLGCDGMFKKTCKKYFQYCRWQPNRVAPDGRQGMCSNLPIPTPESILDQTACFNMNEKACKWWMNQKTPMECVYTPKYGCENLYSINVNCWWTKEENCERAIANGFDCNWNKKLKKCTKWAKLSCYDLVGWTPENAMTRDVARKSCCSTPEKGEMVKGARGTQCTRPKLGDSKFHDCRWCEDHEEGGRCVKAVNCPYLNANPDASN